MELSLVVSGRNDNHSAGFTDRLFTALEFNTGLLKKSGIGFEIIWVEWNAVPGKPLLAVDILARYPEARAVVAGPEIHERLSEKPQMKFLQYFAKNVGIRRADAPFILISNSDILLGENTAREIRSLIGRPLEPAVYRATRRDLKPGTGPAHASDPAKWERLNLTTPPYHVEQSGDFILASRTVWQTMRAFNETIRNSELHIDSQFCVQAYRSGLDVCMIGDVYHLYHEGSWTHLSADQRSNSNLARGENFDYMKSLPYANSPNWGLSDFSEERVADRTIRLRINKSIQPSRDDRVMSDPLWDKARANLSRRKTIEEDLAVLKRHIRHLWIQIGNDPVCRSKGVALYGAGRYTEWLMKLVDEEPGPEVRFVLDDYVQGQQTVAGIRVVMPASISAADVGAIVISSDVYEEVLAERCEKLFGQRLNVIRLHRDMPKGLYLLDH